MLTILEKKLLEVGYDGFDTTEKNAIIKEMARKSGIPYNQVTEDFILQRHKEIKISQFSLMSDKIITEGFVSSNGHTYRTNKDDQMNLIGKMVHLMLDPSVAEVQWKTEDVGYITHTKNEWIMQVFVEGLSHKEKNLFKFNTKKKQIEDATTDVGLVSIRWD